MLSSQQASAILLAFDQVTVKDHFGSDAFSANGRMFATVWATENKVHLRLSVDLQRHYLLEDEEAFLEIKNKWGQQGWTHVDLGSVDRKLFTDAAKASWKHSTVKAAQLKAGSPKPGARPPKKISKPFRA